MFRDDHGPTQSESTRRILGMKVWQAAVLAGFIVVDILVVVIGLTLVMSTPVPAAPSGPAGSPQPPTLPPMTRVITAAPTPTETALPTQTEIPFPTEAPADTATPTGPAATGTAVPAGWTEYTTDKFTIQLPDSYAGGNPQKDSSAIIEALIAKGAQFDTSGLVQLLSTYGDDTPFWAADSYTGIHPFMVNIAILRMPTDPDEPMADAVTRILGGLAQDYTLSEQRQMINKYFEMQEVTMIPKDPNQAATQIAVYVMKSDDVLLGMICAAPTADWIDRLRQFDQIAKSIRLILPVPTAAAVS